MVRIWPQAVAMGIESRRGRWEQLRSQGCQGGWLPGRGASGRSETRASPRFHLRRRGPSGGQRAWRKRSFPLSHGRSEVLKGHGRETQVQRGEGGRGVGLGVTPPGQAGCPPGVPMGAVFLPVGWLSACAEVTRLPQSQGGRGPPACHRRPS